MAKARIFLVVLLAFALGTASTPSAAISQNELIDLAIDAVNPDLKEAKPVVACAIGGTAVDTCVKNYASAKSSQQINDNLGDIDRIVRVYKLAKAGDFPGLVSNVGVTVACVTFGEVPGASYVCNEYAAKIAAAGEYAIKATSSVVAPAAKAALAWISKTAGKFGCAIGFSCPKETNPNQYVVDFPSSGSYALDKFDLNGIWKQDYAPRVAEGIEARLIDPNHYKLMLLPSDSHDNRFMLPEQLGSATINKLSGATTIGPVWLYKFAFAPFQKELNQQFAAIVNARAAGLVEESAARFAKVRDNWMLIRLPVQAEQQFDSPLLSVARHYAFKQAVAECVRNVEDPNFGLFRWAESGVAVGDGTTIDGQGAAVWAKGKGWCQAVYGPALAKENQARRKDFDQAMALGCNRRPNGAKGLVCPAIKPGTIQTMLGPMSYCLRAYKSSAKTYCSAAAGEAAAAAPGAMPAPAPIRPRLRIPGIAPVPAPAPAPEATAPPAPSPAPTLAPLRPKILPPKR